MSAALPCLGPRCGMATAPHVHENVAPQTNGYRGLLARSKPLHLRQQANNHRTAVRPAHAFVPLAKVAELTVPFAGGPIPSGIGGGGTAALSSDDPSAPISPSTAELPLLLLALLPPVPLLLAAPPTAAAAGRSSTGSDGWNPSVRTYRAPVTLGPRPRAKVQDRRSQPPASAACGPGGRVHMNSFGGYVHLTG